MASRDDRRHELAQPSQGPEVLGHISGSSPLLNSTPQGTETTWVSPEGPTITLTEPPPPWEMSTPGHSASDARNFVEVPANWKLRWVNPRLLDSEGWRDWQALMASDQRVKVKVSTMVTPENYVRRGGPGGDILCWMWAGWYESKIRLHREATAQQSQSAVDRQTRLKEEFASNTFGPNVRLAEAKHPTHTLLDGKSLQTQDP